jgi:hypothetical protein
MILARSKSFQRDSAKLKLSDKHFTLICQIEADTVKRVRMGSHSQLFRAM